MTTEQPLSNWTDVNRAKQWSQVYSVSTRLLVSSQAFCLALQAEEEAKDGHCQVHSVGTPQKEGSVGDREFRNWAVSGVCFGVSTKLPRNNTV